VITLLDSVGPAIWRASWQAAALTALVALLLRCCGERLAPRWRFLLWGVVLARLLVVATPLSPWSVFNLLTRAPQPSAPPIVRQHDDATVTPVAHSDRPNSPAGRAQSTVESPRVADPLAKSDIAQVITPAETQSTSSKNTIGLAPTIASPFDAVFITRVLSAIWLAGCLLLGLRLLAAAIVLRRRLSACRPVMDVAVLELL
jgi:beta-lactamase regulating signal transducer with metallopeptidase domain